MTLYNNIALKIKMLPLFQHRPSLRFSIFVLSGFLLVLSAVTPAKAGNRVVAWGAGTNTDTLGNNYGQSVVPATLTNAVLVSGGRWHSLALNTNGTLTGWGNNTNNQFSFPSGSNYNYVSIACGYLHSLALQTNGTVVAVGDDGHGQTDVPANLSNVVAVACGWYHCLALKSDGTVVSWGTDTNPADFGIDDVSYGQSLVPAGLSNVVAVAGGGWHSLALKSDGTVVAWGATDPTVVNSVDEGQSLVPPGLSNVVAITAGAAHSMALKANGQIVAWGANIYGQTNVPASLTNGVVAIAAGGWHNLALLANGTVTAWGAGVATNIYVGFGQNIVPAGLTNVIQIAAGLYHSLALVGSGPPKVKAPLTIANLGTNGFAIGCPTRNGHVYRLEYSSALTNQAWKTFPLQAGLGGTNQFADPTRSAASRFYRVSKW